MKSVFRIFTLLLPAVMMIGCYESADVTIKQPGIYKGMKDPILAREQTPQQQEKLLARFKLVQVDR